MAQVEDRLAGAVARQLGLRAVRVEDPQARDEAGLRRARRARARRRRRARSAGRTAAAPARAVSSNGTLGGLDDEVVVAQGLPLLEAHGGHHADSRARSAACSSRRHLVGRAARHVDRRHVGELAHPGELALGVAPRLGLHRLDVAVEQRLEAERLAGAGRGAGRHGGADLVLRAGGDHRVHAGLDALDERLAVHRQAGQQRRAAQRRGPQPRGLRAGRRRLPGVEQLERAGDALGVGGADRGGGRGRAPGQLGVQGGRAVRLELRAPAGADLRRARAGAGRARRARRAGTGRCRRRRSAAGPRRAARRSRRGRRGRTPPRSTSRSAAACRRAGARAAARSAAPGAPVRTSRPRVELQRVGRDRRRDPPPRRAGARRARSPPRSCRSRSARRSRRWWRAAAWRGVSSVADVRPDRHRPLHRRRRPRGGARGGRRGAGRACAASRCDLAIVFASGTHLIAPEALLEAVHEALAPEELVGCGAGGVIGPHREIEDGTAVSIWAAHLDGGTATRLPRRRRGARGGRRRADRDAGPRGRRRRDPARRPGHVPDRRRAALPVGLHADDLAARRARLGRAPATAPCC